MKFESDAEVGQKRAFFKGLIAEGKRMTKVTAKYQITIPPEVRRELGIVPGSEVDISS